MEEAKGILRQMDHLKLRNTKLLRRVSLGMKFYGSEAIVKHGEAHTSQKEQGGKAWNSLDGW